MRGDYTSIMHDTYDNWSICSYKQSEWVDHNLFEKLLEFAPFKRERFIWNSVRHFINFQDFPLAQYRNCLWVFSVVVILLIKIFDAVFIGIVYTFYYKVCSCECLNYYNSLSHVFLHYMFVLWKVFPVWTCNFLLHLEALLWPLEFFRFLKGSLSCYEFCSWGINFELF